MALIRQRVNPGLENDILTALITSTSFIDKARKWYQPHYFSDYGRIIAEWVMDYYGRYRQAPERNIQNIYNVEQEKLTLALSQNVATYLGNLNADYESHAEFNEPYMLEQARVYFKRKAYEYLFSRGLDLIRAGEEDKAEELLSGFKTVASATSAWENPLDQRVIRTHFADREDDINIVLNYQGALGQMAGNMERGWLVAYLGPMKRGKSFWIQESMFAGAARRKRVAYINLEMMNQGVRDREYKRLTGLSEKGGNIQFPVFDCFWNQTGECLIPEYRTNDITLRLDNGNLPRFTDPGTAEYRVCTACRDIPEVARSFMPDVWYTTYTQKDEYNETMVARRAGAFMRQYGDRIRQITYPAYSVTIDDIRRDLEELMYADGFIPDIVLADYADIIAPRHQTGSERDHLNQVWKAMKSEAGQMKALWVSGSQTNRKALEKDIVGGTDVAEDIRKLAHIDALFGINQTDKEKEDLVTRINTIAHRHKKFSPRAQIMVLHQLEIGMPYIDSAWLT